MLIRKAKLSDLDGILSLHLAVWEDTYRGVLSEEHLSVPDEDRESYTRLACNVNPKTSLYVAETEPGKLIGFAAGGPERSGRLQKTGELYAIYILPSYQRAGIGRSLMESIAKILKEAGFKSMIAWAFEKNPYRKFYEDLGGREFKRGIIEIGGTEYPATAYGWADVSKPLATEKPGLISRLKFRLTFGIT